MGLLGLFKEEGLQILWQLTLEDVAHESLADVSSAAFVAKDVAQGRIAGMKGLSVVEAGVAPCAKDADDAWGVLAHASGGSQHVALHMDGGVRVDDLSEGAGHKGCLLRGASCAVEVES